MTAAARPTEAELDALDADLIANRVFSCKCVPSPKDVTKHSRNCTYRTLVLASDALAALRAERDALRKALRKRAIDANFCFQCNHFRNADGTENHAEGCLAAPPKEPNNG